MASRISLFFTSIVLAFVVFMFPRWEKERTEATLAWDVSGYYLYLPATVIYRDLEKLEFLPHIIEKYVPSYSPEQAFQLDNGNMCIKYPAGMAVLYSPFFFTAHIYANISDYPPDGFSLPYQIAIQLGGLFYAILGLVFLRKILIRYFSESTSAGCILLIGLGTNFFNYGTFDSGNVHVWTFALLAMLTYLTILFHEKTGWKKAIGIGACIGLAALARPTEIVFFLVPLFWGIVDRSSFFEKIELFKNHFPKICAAIFVTLLIGSIQLFYWKNISGDWLIYSYEDQEFSWSTPHFMDVFFSYRKGWFVYTPLMFFSLLGFIFLIKKWLKKGSPYILPIIIFILINTWIIASWDIWWYGGAFGQRAMIPSYILLAFPLAALMEWIKNRRWKQWVFYPLFFGCIFLNLFQTYQAHWGPWEALAMNKAYYWKIFGTTEINLSDQFSLDTNEAFFGQKQNSEILYESDIEHFSDTVGLSYNFVHAGNFALAVNEELKFSKGLKINYDHRASTHGWLTLEGWFAIKSFVPSYWYMPQCVVRFWNDGEVVKTSFFRPARIIYKKNKWEKIAADIKLPNQSFDQIEIFLWNKHDMGSLYADDLKVILFGP